MLLPVRKFLWVHGVAMSLATDTSYIKNKLSSTNSAITCFAVFHLLGFLFCLYSFFFKKLIRKCTTAIFVQLLQLYYSYQPLLKQIFLFLYVPHIWGNVLNDYSAVHIYIFVQWFHRNFDSDDTDRLSLILYTLHSLTWYITLKY